MRRLTLSLIGLIVIFSMALVSCQSAETTSTTTSATKTGTSTTSATNTTTQSGSQTDKSYKALDPTGLFIPVNVTAISKRLDTLDGKTVQVNQGEADPVIMPALWKIVQQKYPKVKWLNYAVSSFGQTAPDDDTKKTAQAIIRGIGW